MKKSESGIEFDFKDKFFVEKFDDTHFYRTSFNKFPHCKGVDFIVRNSDTILLMEVKNCKGYENNNRWRISPNNKKLTTTSTTVDTEDRSSLDIEMAQKIAMTLVCLIGANSKPEDHQKSDILKPFCNIINKNDIALGKKFIKVILFLEGNFSTHTQTEKKIMKDLKDSIKAKLAWLNCSILVENINTHAKDVYSARII